MTTAQVLVGTTVLAVIAKPREQFFIDVFIYNNSANLVYVLSEQNADITQGIPLAINGGFYSNPRRVDPVFLVAAGAGSDVRVHYVLVEDSTLKAV